MKKFLASILVVSIFATLLFSGCGKPVAPEDAFVAPENYVSVVQITINPTANLYLDADNVVLAVEYVNVDAKECYSKVESEIVGKNLDAAVNVVVSTAQQDGYFAENKAVTIDLVETKTEEKKAEVLNTATASVKAVLTEKNIQAEVKLSEASQKVVEDKAAADKAAADKAAADKAAADKAAADKAAADKAAADKAAADKAAADKAAADKAAADKAAADKAAKEKELKNPQKNLKKNVDYCMFELGETDETMTIISIKFKDNGEYSIGLAPLLNDPYGEGEYYIYNGNKYYFAGGGAGSGGTYTTTTERIILSGGESMEFSLTTDGQIKLEVLNEQNEHFAVGDLLKIVSEGATVTVK